MKCIGIAVHPLPQGGEGNRNRNNAPLFTLGERATEVETTPLFPLGESGAIRKWNGYRLRKPYSRKGHFFD
jgi:hypothetical protein